MTGYGITGDGQAPPCSPLRQQPPRAPAALRRAGTSLDDLTAVLSIFDIKDNELTSTSKPGSMRFSKIVSGGPYGRRAFSDQRGDLSHGHGVRGLSAQRLLDLVDARRNAARRRA